MGVAKRSGRTATEVAQLYVHDELATLSRPVMQLRGAESLTLGPGESREVSFPLTWDDLAMIGRDGRWVTEPGSFRLMVGASSKDIRLQTHWTLR